MVDPNSALAQSWQRIGDEITSRVRPTTIVLLSPLRFVPPPSLVHITHHSSHRSKTSAVTINSSPLAPLLYSHTSSNPYQPPFTCAGSTAVANTIHRLLAESALLSVRTWERGLDPASWGVLVGLFGNTVEAKVVQVSLPVTADPAVTVEYLFEVGARLREMRDEGVVVIGIGRAPKSVSPRPRRSAELTLDRLLHRGWHSRTRSPSTPLSREKSRSPHSSRRRRARSHRAGIAYRPIC